MAENDKITVEIVIPAYNEATILDQSIRGLREFLTAHTEYNWSITISEGGSTDNTFEIAERLSRKFANVKSLHFGKNSKGQLIKRVWLRSEADILVYIDADLSPELNGILKIVSKISSGFDVVTTSRLLKRVNTIRSFKRDIISRVYNFLLKLFFATKFTDAQCGLKGIRRDIAGQLLPFIKSKSWFFDSELLLLAEGAGYKVCELPVKWIERIDSRLKLVEAIPSFLVGILHLKLRLLINGGRQWNLMKKRH